MEIATIVAEITSNSSVVDVSTVSVASSIIEELTTAAIEDEEVSLNPRVHIFSRIM